MTGGVRGFREILLSWPHRGEGGLVVIVILAATGLAGGALRDGWIVMPEDAEALVPPAGYPAQHVDAACQAC